ncbi:DUF1963 domain-containing protein [Nonomuraea sp. NPDC049695]|uniref:DUF1963 domain-containing protein n=1 Tax=Nonomuraea sp. NPDC049695 TaxID=3154734 RepID=UPI00343912CC
MDETTLRAPWPGLSGACDGIGRMDHQSEAAYIRSVCVEFLGEHLGSQLAALARPGFGLSPAGESRPAAGRSRLGGAALLDPETPWPYTDELPLSLYAVLDTDELAPWLGDELPVRPGLLNFFLDDFEDCRVIPADPASAVELRSPDDHAFATVPLHAKPGLSLPDMWWGGALEDLIEGFGLDPGPDLTSICDPEESVTSLFAGDDSPGGYYPGAIDVDQAFGWPLWIAPGDPLPDLRGEYTHLLHLSSNLGEWEFPKGGSLNFLIPRQALRDGDYSQAFVALDVG